MFGVEAAKEIIKKRGRNQPPHPCLPPLKLFRNCGKSIKEKRRKGKKKKKVKKENVELSFWKSLCVQVESVFIVLTSGLVKNIRVPLFEDIPIYFPKLFIKEFLTRVRFICFRAFSDEISDQIPPSFSF